jgi:hypothetical protein
LGASSVSSFVDVSMRKNVGRSLLPVSGGPTVPSSSTATADVTEQIHVWPARVPPHHARLAAKATSTIVVVLTLLVAGLYILYLSNAGFKGVVDKFLKKSA